jgi:hypothetical protein
MGSSSSKVIATGYASSLVAPWRVKYVAMNAATSKATGSPADALIELYCLLQPICHVTDINFATEDGKGVV